MKRPKTAANTFKPLALKVSKCCPSIWQKLWPTRTTSASGSVTTGCTQWQPEATCSMPLKAKLIMHATAAATATKPQKVQQQ